jgi:hypothetical protein
MNVMVLNFIMDSGKTINKDPHYNIYSKTFMDKIFVNVVAYRDPFLQYTIKDVLKKAKYPERVVFGVCWQYG